MNYRNPKYCSDSIRIDCEIEHPAHGWVPFTCDPSDNGAEFNTLELYQEMIASGQVAKPTQQEIDDHAAALVRMERDARLATDVDPIATNPLRLGALTTEQQQALQQYRQSLLDLPAQPGFPHDVAWPEAIG